MAHGVRIAHQNVKAKRTPLCVHCAQMIDIAAQDTEADRLVQARIRRGIGDAKATAKFFGWPYNTYIQHERGERGLRKPVAEKYAKAFRVSLSWLLTGQGNPGWPATTAKSSEESQVETLTISRELLRQALQFVLENEGIPLRRAALIADILPEALAGPQVEVVDRDPLLSFQIHYELVGQRSELPRQR